MSANPWKPDQPLPDADDEKEAQRRAQANARVKFLTDQLTPPPPEPKKKKSAFSAFGE